LRVLQDRIGGIRAEKGRLQKIQELELLEEETKRTILEKARRGLEERLEVGTVEIMETIRIKFGLPFNVNFLPPGTTLTSRSCSQFRVKCDCGAAREIGNHPEHLIQ
jgi:hypothetical protein